MQSTCNRTDKCLKDPVLVFSQTIKNTNLEATIGVFTMKLGLKVIGSAKGAPKFDSAGGPVELFFGCGPNGSRTVVDYINGTATLSYKVTIGAGPAAISSESSLTNEKLVGLGDVVAKWPH
jgi:hypothetical protein